MSQEKWEKTQTLLKELMLMLEAGDDLLRYIMGSIRGFLFYVAQTYRYFNAYLQGVHNFIYRWIPGMNEEVWKFPTSHRIEGTLMENGTCHLRERLGLFI